jgi:cytochrome d ubiquinol oxidase subunit II
LFGIFFANVFRGVPIDAAGIFHGNLLTLLNPYSIMGGLLFLCFFLTHGAVWLALKTDGDLQARAALKAKKFWRALLVVSVLFLFFSAPMTNLYENYVASPILFVIPLIAVAALVLDGVFIHKGDWLKAWFASALYIFSATLFGVIGIYPALLPSSLDPAYSRTIHNTASSSLTLTIMLVVVLIFVPIVIVYQVWVHKLFGGKVSGDYSGYYQGL